LVRKIPKNLFRIKAVGILSEEYIMTEKKTYNEPNLTIVGSIEEITKNAEMGPTDGLAGSAVG
jgi:hypothetical protein